MTTLLSIVALGFFLGMRHALDADHVVAVTTFVSRERSVSRSSVIGMIWGLGHTTTILLVGGSIILFGLVIPDKVGLSLEFGVALMLIVIGVLNIDAFQRKMRNPHEEQCAAAVREERLPGWLASSLQRFHLQRVLRPFFVGCVHGMAGSAALAFVVLPLIRDPFWAMVYLAVFGLGSVAGMMLITAAISWPCLKLAGSSTTMPTRFATAAGILSMSMGLFLAYHIGIIEGLFTSAS